MGFSDDSHGCILQARIASKSAIDIKSQFVALQNEWHIVSLDTKEGYVEITYALVQRKTKLVVSMLLTDGCAYVMLFHPYIPGLVIRRSIFIYLESAWSLLPVASS